MNDNLSIIESQYLELPKEPKTTFCDCCSEQVQEELRSCDICYKRCCEDCLKDVELLEGRKFVTRKLCKDCEFKERVQTVEESISLIYSLTGRANVKDGIELTFSPSNERDFVILIKKELF